MSDLPEVLPPQTQAQKEVYAIQTGGDIAPLVPHNLDEAFRMAQYVVAAGLAPNSYDNDPKKIVVGIMKSLEIGVAPLTGLSNIAIINNRPSVWGDLAMALVQRTGALEWSETTDIGDAPEAGDELSKWPDSYGVQVTIKRRGQEKPYPGTFTVGEAKRAKLWLNSKKTPWMDYPKRMLTNRARAFALRDGFADCLMGLSIREEVEDMPQVAAAPIDTSFLDDPKAIEHRPAIPTPDLATAPEAAAQPVSEPLAQTTEERAEGGYDDVRDDLQGYIEALPSKSTLDDLAALHTVATKFLKDKGRDDLLPVWNAEKLSRERQIRAVMR